MATGNMHKKFDEIRPCGFRAIRDTESHSVRPTCHLAEVTFPGLTPANYGL